MRIIERGDTTQSRNTAFARVWTARHTPVAPSELSVALYGRGFIPGFEAESPDTGAETNRTLTDTDLVAAQFIVGGGAFVAQSLSSGRGSGCRVTVEAATASDLPDDYLARRAVPRPTLVYTLEAATPSNSDRALTEHLAEFLMEHTDGVAEVSGLGTKGNKPKLHIRPWLGSLPL